FDDRPGLWNYGDTLARRAEAYHARLAEATTEAGEGKSIHEGLRVKEPGLAALAAAVDTRGRESFLDRWMDDQVTQDWAGEEFWAVGEGFSACAFTAPAGEAPALAKRYRVGADGMLEVEYTLTSDRPRLGRLTVEVNLGLHVAEAPDRYVEIE